MQNNSKSWNIIYAFSVDNKAYEGYLKIGQTSIPANSSDYREVDKEVVKEAARKRINEITGTAGLNAKLEHAELALRKDGDKLVLFSDEDFNRF